MKNHNEPRKLQLSLIKNKQQSHLRKHESACQPGTCLTRSPTERLNELKELITLIKKDVYSPFVKPSRAAMSFLKDAISMYERELKSSIGVPSYMDDSTLQYEAPNDIPTLPLSGLVPIQRTAYIVKLASQGTTAGGFYVDLLPTDFKPWCATGSYFRLKKITSWTTNRQDGSLTQGTFAGVSVPVSQGSAGTEVLPIWSENFEPVGQGFAGIVTKYPLGAFPLYSVGDTVVICSHFSALGGTGGVTGIPIVFHAVIETLI